MPPTPPPLRNVATLPNPALTLVASYLADDPASILAFLVTCRDAWAFGQTNKRKLVTIALDAYFGPALWPTAEYGPGPEIHNSFAHDGRFTGSILSTATPDRYAVEPWSLAVVAEVALRRHRVGVLFSPGCDFYRFFGRGWLAWAEEKETERPGPGPEGSGSGSGSDSGSDAPRRTPLWPMTRAQASRLEAGLRRAWVLAEWAGDMQASSRVCRKFLGRAGDASYVAHMLRLLYIRRLPARDLAWLSILDQVCGMAYGRRSQKAAREHEDTGVLPTYAFQEVFLHVGGVAMWAAFAPPGARQQEPRQLPPWLRGRPQPDQSPSSKRRAHRSAQGKHWSPWLCQRVHVTLREINAAELGWGVKAGMFDRPYQDENEVEALAAELLLTKRVLPGMQQALMRAFMTRLSGQWDCPLRRAHPEMEILVRREIGFADMGPA